MLSIALTFLTPNSTILDLACGDGRNGLLMAQHGFNLTYIDRNQSALDQIKTLDQTCVTQCIDLETTPPYQLPKNTFDAVMVYRYLHRPLMPTIIDTIKPGGYIIYQTFTEQQATIGRPKNPDFLLKQGELKEVFAQFDVKHFFEGYCDKQQAYLSRIISRKPS